MGICISVASSEIHEAEDAQENVLYFETTTQNIINNNNRPSSSLYSKPGSKGLNQDAAVLCQGYGMEEGAFCAVFDGHGKNGHIVSKFVRDQLPSLLLTQKNALSKVKPIGFNDMWKEACVNAFKVMDKEIKLQENLDCSCSGTTSVVVIKQGDNLVIANLGDSRAVLGTLDSENGEIKAVQLTTDLKPGLPSEAERIRKCNGRVLALKEEPHIQRVWLPNDDSPGLAMSRAFGDFVLKPHGVIAIPDVSCRRISSDDQFVLLATDGVLDVLSNKEVVSIVWEADNEQEAARAVVDAANAAWKKKFPSSKIDDCTVACLFLQKRQQLDSVLSVET